MLVVASRALDKAALTKMEGEIVLTQQYGVASPINAELGKN